MNEPFINILIRVSRPELFKRCMESIRQQAYSNYLVLLHADSYDSFTGCVKEYLHKNERGEYDSKVSLLPYSPLPPKDHHWNLYCNILKDNVKEGWFFFMDDDDYLVDEHALQRLATHLTEDTEGLICQFIRNGKPKPNNALIEYKVIKKGLIGGGCLVLHSRHKMVADWEAKPASDFDWIAAVAKIVPLKFVPLVVQVTGNNGLHGQKIMSE